MFREMLSSAAGFISSKRVAMIWFIAIFTVVIFVNLFTGKKLHEDLQFQLFELTIATMVIVFGEPFMQALSFNKNKSATSTTTTIVPENSTVITKETVTQEKTS
jgi:hypothetical protein